MCPHFQKSECPSEWECQFQSLGYAFCQGAGACTINRGDVCNSEESSGRESTELKLFTLRLSHDRVVSWFNFSDLGLFPLRYSHVVLLDLKAVNLFNYLA